MEAAGPGRLPYYSGPLRNSRVIFRTVCVQRATWYLQTDVHYEWKNSKQFMYIPPNLCMSCFALIASSKVGNRELWEKFRIEACMFYSLEAAQVKKIKEKELVGWAFIQDPYSIVLLSGDKHNPNSWLFPLIFIMWKVIKEGSITAEGWWNSFWVSVFSRYVIEIWKNSTYFFFK